MSINSAEQAVDKIRFFVESFPPATVSMAINRSPEVNVDNEDYYVEMEIILLPKKAESLSVTIWLCAESIGFFVDTFEKAARISKLKVSEQKKGLTCVGTEPVRFVSVESLLGICKLVSVGKLDISIGILAGVLSGVYADIDIGSDKLLHCSVGVPKSYIEMASVISLGEIRSLQYEAW